MWGKTDIPGVLTRHIKEFHDHRGWLAETFRIDETDSFSPKMGYISVTKPGITRGPHEHRDQTDYFCFFGKFSLYLWDNRKESITYMKNVIIEDADRMIVIVPPRVVHAYKNNGDSDGMVLNFPDSLYRGWGKKKDVDEVRYEDNPESPFKIEIIKSQ